jgi:GGDEF domain-containing protein
VRESIRRSETTLGPWPVEVSIGSSIIDDQQLDVDVLIRQADDDMYTRRRARRALT